MKYIELIYCKLVWFNTKTYLNLFSTKFEFYKWPTWSILYDARRFIGAPLWALAIIIMIGSAYTKNTIESIVFMPYVISFITHWYISRHLKIQMRTSRIVFNKEYMQSKWGVVLTLLYMSPFILLFIFGIVGLIVLAQ